jgi:uncharacterized BrkB/YihY/UPF0761 family membrane protein
VQAFNNIAHEDNNISHEDNAIMKSIALLTMFFLPATFFSVCIVVLIVVGAALTQLQSLFSTTFFSFGDSGWESSSRIWIYWVFAIPVTVVVLLIYGLWYWFRKTHRKGESWDDKHP